MNPAERSDRETLEGFLIDNPQLERLEILLGEFNFFEAVGVVRQELRHSDFLAFLLDPKGTHGLGDSFLTLLLRKAVQASDLEGLPFTAVDVTLWNLADTEVRREWKNTDVLLLNRTLELVIVIENKIGSGEHSDQLRRYMKMVSREFPGWKTAGIYLTPGGDTPSEAGFISCSYDLVYDAIQSLLESRTTVMGEDIRAVVKHYSQLLQRHVVSDSEIAELCRKIYRRHQRALDLIYEHRPDRAAIAQQHVLSRLQAEESVVLDHFTKGHIRFLPVEWDLDALRVGEGWTPSGRMLLFEIRNESRGIVQQLYLGPGPFQIRETVFEAAVRSPVLRPTSRALNKKWNALIGGRLVIGASDLEELEEEALEARVSEFFQTLFEKEWTPIVECLTPVLRTLASKDSEWGSGS